MQLYIGIHKSSSISSIYSTNSFYISFAMKKDIFIWKKVTKHIIYYNIYWKIGWKNQNNNQKWINNLCGGLTLRVLTYHLCLSILRMNPLKINSLFIVNLFLLIESLRSELANEVFCNKNHLSFLRTQCL